LDEEALMAEGHISLEDHLKHSEITKLIQTPVEVIAFCEEEGVRYQPHSPSSPRGTKRRSSAYNSMRGPASVMSANSRDVRQGN